MIRTARSVCIALSVFQVLLLGAGFFLLRAYTLQSRKIDGDVLRNLLPLVKARPIVGSGQFASAIEWDDYHFGYTNPCCTIAGALSSIQVHGGQEYSFADIVPVIRLENRNSPDPPALQLDHSVLVDVVLEFAKSELGIELDAAAVDSAVHAFAASGDREIFIYDQPVRVYLASPTEMSTITTIHVAAALLAMASIAAVAQIYLLARIARAPRSPNPLFADRRQIFP